ncbi:hypothetical protein WJ70_17685 [Burkholderia ubonensis]|nr:hypothetical protein WJ70_17685 [Burkholderia ubonensis]
MGVIPVAQRPRNGLAPRGGGRALGARVGRGAQKAAQPATVDFGSDSKRANAIGGGDSDD